MRRKTSTETYAAIVRLERIEIALGGVAVGWLRQLRRRALPDVLVPRCEQQNGARLSGRLIPVPARRPNNEAKKKSVQRTGEMSQFLRDKRGAGSE